MAWIVAVLGTLIVGVVAALAIPVQLDLSAALTDRLRGRVRLRWGFATINVRGRTTDAKKPAPAVTPRSARPTGRGRAALAALLTPGLVPRVVRFVRELVDRIHVRRFRLRARYGLDDPADTGQVCGALAPVLALVSARGMDVQCLPEFTDEVIDGSCSGTIAVRPLSVLAVMIAFLCSPPVWRAARAWRRAS